MKERPILFSGPMVKAILEGRKTQTRRVALALIDLNPKLSWRVGQLGYLENKVDGGTWYSASYRCPYGAVGDRLWVRETWMPDGADVRFEMMKRGEIPWRVRYAASEPELGKMFKWHPSIHMPRIASRLNLEITGVRVERVKEISSEDATAEGVRYFISEPDDADKVSPMINVSERPCVLDYLPKNNWTHEMLMVAHYARLWDSINSERGFGWEKNPWVWVIEFKRVAA